MSDHKNVSGWGLPWLRCGDDAPAWLTLEQASARASLGREAMAALVAGGVVEAKAKHGELRIDTRRLDKLAPDLRQGRRRGYTSPLDNMGVPAREAAARVGMSPAELTAAARAGKINVVTVGGFAFVLPADVEAYIEAHPGPTRNPEILTVREAASYLSVGMYAVEALIASGAVKAAKVEGGDWQIRRAMLPDAPRTPSAKTGLMGRAALTPREAADTLGVSTVDGLIKSGELPVQDVNGRQYIRRPDLERFERRRRAEYVNGNAQ